MSGIGHLLYDMQITHKIKIYNKISFGVASYIAVKLSIDA
jgi:hypothetical protein